MLFMYMQEMLMWILPIKTCCKKTNFKNIYLGKICFTCFFFCGKIFFPHNTCSFLNSSNVEYLFFPSIEKLYTQNKFSSIKAESCSKNIYELTKLKKQYKIKDVQSLKFQTPVLLTKNLDVNSGLVRGKI